MKKNKLICNALFALLFCSLLSSCGSVYYASTQPNMPMVKEKGVTKIDASLGVGEMSTSVELNGFHSVSSHAGIMGNFTSQYLDGNELNAFDIGAGYFTPTGKNSGFEVYSTIGYGKLKLYDFNYDGTEDSYGSTSMYRFAIQPDLFFTSKHFEAAIGFRLHYFKFDNIYNYDGYIEYSDKHLMLEPSAKIAFGFGGVKLSLQGTMAQKLNEGFLSYEQFMIAAGLSFRFNSKKPANIKTP